MHMNLNINTGRLKGEAEMIATIGGERRREKEGRRKGGRRKKRRFFWQFSKWIISCEKTRRPDSQLISGEKM